MPYHNNYTYSIVIIYITARGCIYKLFFRTISDVNLKENTSHLLLILSKIGRKEKPCLFNLIFILMTNYTGPIILQGIRNIKMSISSKKNIMG